MEAKGKKEYTGYCDWNNNNSAYEVNSLSPYQHTLLWSALFFSTKKL